MLGFAGEIAFGLGENDFYSAGRTLSMPEEVSRKGAKALSFLLELLSLRLCAFGREIPMENL